MPVKSQNDGDQDLSMGLVKALAKYLTVHSDHNDEDIINTKSVSSQLSQSSKLLANDTHFTFIDKNSNNFLTMIYFT
jgi:hypothetical protein